MEERTKFILSEKEVPRAWYNINPDLPKPLAPPINPQTLKPLTPDDLSVLFPMDLIMQEMSMENWIEIPDEVREIYKLWRPTPMYRAMRLEKALDTPAKIYYKYEGVSGPGSHKPNTAVAQAYYNKKEGTKRLTTETGAGQWGSALAYACNAFGLDCTVYMVKVSYEQKPYRKTLMNVWGANVIPSPSDKTQIGKKILSETPDSLGSLGIAISEAVEDAATHNDTKYSLGSVLNHVLLHQTVVGLEVKKQMELAEDYPDIIVGCVGGGSNFSGLFFPFVKEKINGKKIRFIAVEPTACPTLTKGLYAYDYGDSGKIGPIAMMYTLGHGFVPSGIHAGGLRYHGDAPQLCLLYDEGLVEAKAYNQLPVFDAAVLFTKTEGILPAPESAHAVKGAIDEALACKESGQKKTILIGLSGHGHFDLGAYEQYLAGKMQDFEYSKEEVEKAIADLPKVPAF
jgi:tryptophan synthase beta chain